MELTEREKVLRAERFADIVSQLPIEEQIAVATISKNVINGCCWELVRGSNPEIRRNLEAFKKSATCSVTEITYNHKRNEYGYILYMKMDRLCKILGPIGGAVDQKDLNYAMQHRQEACVQLSKRMQKGYSGKIGIYCTNDSPNITVDGKTYPAFAVTLMELLQICQKFNYGIMVNGSVRDPQEVAKRANAVIKSLIVAPSSNGLFIDIAPRM